MPMLDFGLLYEAIDDDAAFEALCSHAAGMVGARSATILRFAPEGGPPTALMSYWPVSTIRLFAEEFAHEDPWAATALRLGVLGRTINMDEHLPTERFIRTRFYNELFRAIGDDTGRCLGVNIAAGPARLTVAVHRPHGDAPFGAREAARLDALWPHVARVMRLRACLKEERAGRRAAERDLDASGGATMVLDRSMRVRRLSAAAKAVLDARDGLALVNGALSATDRAAAEALRAGVAATVDRAPLRRSAYLCARPSGRAAYRLLLLPAGPKGEDGALLQVDDPTGGDPGLRRLWVSQAYGLTAAETELADRLLNGLSLKESAEDRGIGLETARTQLSALFAKTGTRRQAELLTLLGKLSRATRVRN